MTSIVKVMSAMGLTLSLTATARRLPAGSWYCSLVRGMWVRTAVSNEPRQGLPYSYNRSGEIRIGSSERYDLPKFSMVIHGPLRGLHQPPTQYVTDPFDSNKTTPQRRQASPMLRISRRASVSTTPALSCPACMAPTTQFLSMPYATLMVHTVVWRSLTQMILPTRLLLRFRRPAFGAVSRPCALESLFSEVLHQSMENAPCWLKTIPTTQKALQFSFTNEKMRLS